MPYEYKTVVCSQFMFAGDTAREIEDIANDYAKEGWRVVSFSVGKGYSSILLLERPTISSE